MAREQVFALANGTNVQPDIFIKTPGSVFVVDITMAFENTNSFQGTTLEKICKYEPLLPVSKEQLGGRKNK